MGRDESLLELAALAQTNEIFTKRVSGVRFGDGCASLCRLAWRLPDPRSCRAAKARVDLTT